MKKTTFIFNFLHLFFRYEIWSISFKSQVFIFYRERKKHADLNIFCEIFFFSPLLLNGTLESNTNENLKREKNIQSWKKKIEKSYDFFKKSIYLLRAVFLQGVLQARRNQCTYNAARQLRVYSQKIGTDSA